MRRDAGVGVGAGDGVLEHVAVAAVELHAAVDDALLQLGAPPLGLGRLLGGELAVVERVDAAVDERLRDVDLGAHLGQHEAGVLERADRAAERLCAP